MHRRIAASALALALLTAGVSAGSAPCCPNEAPAAASIEQPDCCAKEVSCPIASPIAIPTETRDVASLGADAWLPAATSAALPVAARDDVRPSVPEAIAAGPPLYRLHAQLLI